MWEKRECGRIHGLPIFEYPLLSQERVKLRTLNLTGTFTGSIRKKRKKNLEKRECGRIQGLPNFLITPYYLRDNSYELQIWQVYSQGLSK